MRALIVPTDFSHTHARLQLESFDSGEECSFEHMLEVHDLVIEGEEALTDTEYEQDLETAWH